MQTEDLQTTSEYSPNSTFKVVDAWRRGFTGNINFSNTSNETLKDWEFQFKAPFEIRNLWGATLTKQDVDEDTGEILYTVRAASWNRNLRPGQTIKLGFNVDRPVGEISPPSDYRLILPSQTPLSATPSPKTDPILKSEESTETTPLNLPKDLPAPITQSERLTPPKSNNPSENSRFDWENGFEQANWKEQWDVRGQTGKENVSRIVDSENRNNSVLRVQYPAGSSSFSYAKRARKALGGTDFKADLNLEPSDTMRLSYKLRFSDNFDFVKGGKLPGLYGGTGNSGGNIPNGRDGFSTRFMWGKDGAGEVYAYLPTSKRWGTVLGRGNWKFEPGTWHEITQEVKLNDKGKNNGTIKVWFDDQQVLNQEGLTFRSTESLKLDGVFFSTFFGGSSASYATPKDVHVDFDDFQVSTLGQAASTTGNVSPASNSTSNSIFGSNTFSTLFAGVNSAFS